MLEQLDHFNFKCIIWKWLLFSLASTSCNDSALASSFLFLCTICFLLLVNIWYSCLKMSKFSILDLQFAFFLKCCIICLNLQLHLGHLARLSASISISKAAPKLLNMKLLDIASSTFLQEFLE